MYLTGREQALVAEIFKLLADSLSEDELRREVGGRLLELLNADYFGSYVWDGVCGRLDNLVARNMAGANRGDYEYSCQDLEPVTSRSQRCGAAVRATDEVSYDKSGCAESLHDLQRIDGLHWGLHLFAWADGENIGDLRICRGQHRDNFSDHELALLELVRPAFTVALGRARAEARRAKPAGEPAPADVGDAFACLTRREREVVELVTEGLLDKEIAQRLGISYTTVRTHLDRSFQKLGVSNRSRLARIVRPAGR